MGRPELRNGERVRITGLQKAKEYNGRLGTVDGVSVSGKLAVTLDTGKNVAVSPKNLERIASNVPVEGVGNSQKDITTTGRENSSPGKLDRLQELRMKRLQNLERTAGNATVTQKKSAVNGAGDIKEERTTTIGRDKARAIAFAETLDRLQ